MSSSDATAFSPAAGVRNRVLLRGFEADCRQAHAVDRAALCEILGDNAGTEFGRAHGFAALAREPAAWRRALPLQRYEDLAPWIERMAGGEENLLVAEPVRFFAKTSGSTGAGCLIPTPRRHAATFIRFYAGIIPVVPAFGVPGGDEPHPGMALLSAADSGLRTAGGIPYGSASSGRMRRVRPIAEQLWTSPWPVFEVEDVASQWYLHALFAVRDADTRYLWGLFAPHLVEWLRLLGEWREALVRDVADGRVAGWLRLSAAQRAALAERLRPDPPRARAVAAAFVGDDPRFVRRLWPRLRFAMTVITGAFAAHLPRLRRALGDLPIYTSVYSSSEAMVGLNLEIDRPERYVLTPGTAHFEFIPIAEAGREQPDTLGVAEVVEGERYEVVVTTRGGLYRYRLRDVVQVVGRRGQAPVLAFGWRQGTIVDLVGEHCTEAHLLAAVERACARVSGRGDALVDFTVHADVEAGPPRYVVYVELEARVDADALAAAIDAALPGENHVYGNYRRGERIGAPAVRLLPAGGFRRLDAWRLARTPGVAAAQLKPARRVIDGEMLAWLEGQVEGSAWSGGGGPRGSSSAPR
ncbi:MAG: GH3 auxin-responsive promoter family protein [Myxococcales bacterium]|nr:GH3 auxin-responsive promoter family protein [Myxococcales bacterium]